MLIVKIFSILVDQHLLAIAAYSLLAVCQTIGSVCLFWSDHSGISIDIWY